MSGAGLARLAAEEQVLRAAVIAVVLVLATGQSAAVLCAGWCRPGQSAAPACDHALRSTTARLSEADTCSALAFGFPAFVREDVRRPEFAPDAPPAIVTPQLLVHAPSIVRRSGHDSGEFSLFGARPLVLTLRL